MPINQNTKLVSGSCFYHIRALHEIRRSLNQIYNSVL